MRISDWSSDVCSSDLADFRDVLLEATRRTVARYSAAPGSTVFQERRPAPEPRAIPAFLKYRLPMAGNGEPLSHGLLRPLVKFIQQLKLLPSRSEEHPSDLQSLMRTSYDVFCLKKKTRQ